MPFLSPNHHCQSTGSKNITFPDLLSWALPTLSLTPKGSWLLSWRVVKPLTPVPSTWLFIYSKRYIIQSEFSLHYVHSTILYVSSSNVDYLGHFKKFWLIDWLISRSIDWSIDWFWNTNDYVHCYVCYAAILLSIFNLVAAVAAWRYDEVSQWERRRLLQSSDWRLAGGGYTAVCYSVSLGLAAGATGHWRLDQRHARPVFWRLCTTLFHAFWRPG